MHDKEEKNQPFDLEDQELMNMTIQELLAYKKRYEMSESLIATYDTALSSKEQLVEMLEKTHKRTIERLTSKIEKAFYLLEKNKLAKLSRLLAKMMP